MKIVFTNSMYSYRIYNSIILYITLFKEEKIN